MRLRQPLLLKLRTETGDLIGGSQTSLVSFALFSPRHSSSKWPIFINCRHLVTMASPLRPASLPPYRMRPSREEKKGGSAIHVQGGSGGAGRGGEERGGVGWGRQGTVQRGGARPTQTACLPGGDAGAFPLVLLAARGCEWGSVIRPFALHRVCV